MNFRRKAIIDIFTKFGEEGLEIWFSGKRGEGEYKWWLENGQIWEHGFYGNGNREGEYKQWYTNGQIYKHSFYKNGKLNGEYKQWHMNGQIYEHGFYRNGKIVKIPNNIKKGYIYAEGKYWKD